MVEGYVSAAEFKEDVQESLVDIHLNENSELWLVQLPDDQFPDIDGQDLTLDLDQDGELGSVKGSDGTVYTLVNFPSEVAETTAFQPTSSGTNIVGKIARHVSLIHYPEPKQNGAAANTGSRKRMPLSSKTTFTKSHFSTPTRTTTHKNVSSLNRSDSVTGSRKSGRSRQSGDSGPGHSGVSNASGSSEQSHHKKSKTRT